MALQPVNPEQYQPIAQTVLAYFEREDVSIPGTMVEGIVSAKSLMRALVSGQVILAQSTADPKEKATAEKAPPAQPKAVNKKAAPKKKEEKKAA